VPHTDPHLGKRIATLRKIRRLQQVELASLTGISDSMLAKIEQGRRHPSPDLLDAIAQALNVPPERLTGGPGHSDSRVHLAVPVLQDTIATYELPEPGPVRPLPELDAAVQRCVDWRLNSQYARMVEHAPSLIAELQRAVDTHTGADRLHAARLLAAAYRSADAAAYKHGHRDLSARLVELMRWAADIAGDPALTAAAAYVRTETYLAARSLPSGLRHLQKAIDAAPAARTVPLRAALGALHMRAAVVAGRMQARDVAQAHLTDAEALAGSIPEGVYHGTACGPDSLHIHRLAVATELADRGDLAAAVRSAGEWAPPRSMPAERRSHYYIDLGRAQMQLGQPGHALESLEVARGIAPQHVREHGQVRAELATMVRVSRHPSDRLLAFAQWAQAV
jgi:transcriptional regulator with XRE-family HTH domain